MSKDKDETNQNNNSKSNDTHLVSEQAPPNKRTLKSVKGKKAGKKGELQENPNLRIKKQPKKKRKEQYRPNPRVRKPKKKPKKSKDENNNEQP